MKIDIDLILEHGRVFDFKRRAPMIDLRRIVRDLFDELSAAHIDYTLVGCVALLAYVAGRNTQDIDLIINPDDIARM